MFFFSLTQSKNRMNKVRDLISKILLVFATDKWENLFLYLSQDRRRILMGSVAGH